LRASGGAVTLTAGNHDLRIDYIEAGGGQVLKLEWKTPGASDYPASYPYSHASNLFDVTSGSNGTCSISVICNAGTGWDGPTGLGTPNGVGAF